jgi:hypothetical protein
MSKKTAQSKPKLYSFTDHPEHKAQLEPTAKKWIANAMATGPYSDEDKERASIAMRGLYEAANLVAPPREVFAPSPICAAFASGIAAGVWWLRENPGKHKSLFGLKLSEAGIRSAMDSACAIADGKKPSLPVAATYAATDDATDAATRAATDDATYAATDAATYAATDDATDAATRAATRASTDDATYAATDDATDAATYAATYAATRAATRAATDAATYAATRAATRAATDAAVNDLAVRFLLTCAQRAWYMRNGGNQWSGHVARLSFFRHVAQLPIDYTKWEHYEAMAGFGPRYLHAKFWIVSSRPDVLMVDEQNRPHSAIGPFCRWPDGRELYRWHGVEVPGEWIRNPKSIDPRVALEWPNIEQRRCAAEIIGWDRVISEPSLNPRTIDEHADPEIGALLLVELNGRSQKFLRMRCGTGRMFAQRVADHVTTAMEAQEWIWQKPKGGYAPELRT